MTPTQQRIQADLRRLLDREQAIGGTSWAERAPLRERRLELKREWEAEARRIEEERKNG